MKLNYIDIHSHLNLSPLLEDKDKIIQTLYQNSIGTITVGVDYDTSKIALELANQNPEILWATVGQHPNDLPAGEAGNPEEKFIYQKYLDLAKNEKVVAIGECGLDYFRLKGTDEEKQIEVARQKELFIQHIKLAQETNLPLMVHARPSKNSMDAYTEAINILEEYQLGTPSTKSVVNFHFFVGNLEIAQKIVANGWSVSFDGPITFVSDYDEVIKNVPLENIMAETDAPFASPVPYRGQTNYPQYVEYVYKKIAEIKGLEIQIVQDTILNNIKRVFKI